jgi:hypothetical protein
LDLSESLERRATEIAARVASATQLPPEKNGALTADVQDLIEASVALVRRVAALDAVANASELEDWVIDATTEVEHIVWHVRSMAETLDIATE